jgi:uncharacterized protein with NRDE domain
MCIILVAHHAHREYPLVIAANRDEAYSRPAAPAAFWPDQPQIFAGRDLELAGTWLALNRNGRVAAVTNFREGSKIARAPRSRGALVSDYLTGAEPPAAYLERVKREASEYGGFILLAGDLDALYWYSNRGPEPQRIAPGVHGLSNHLLNTPWPKIRRSRQVVQALLHAPEAELAASLFALLADRSPAPDDELPDTGVGLERERALSPVFIAGEHYGTRAATVVLVHRDGEVLFAEKSFGPSGAPLGDVEERFRIERVGASAAG